MQTAHHMHHRFSSRSSYVFKLILTNSESDWWRMPKCDYRDQCFMPVNLPPSQPNLHKFTKHFKFLLSCYNKGISFQRQVPYHNTCICSARTRIITLCRVSLLHKCCPKTEPKYTKCIVATLLQDSLSVFVSGEMKWATEKGG